MKEYKTLKLVKELIKKRNYELRFNSNISRKKNKEINALIKKENNNVIIELNLNSIKTIEFLIIHEITHDISSNDIKELIYNYSKKENEFKNISEEIIADICGDLLGNKEFIESVLQRNLNIFYKELNKKNLKEEYLSFIKNLSILWMESFYSDKSNLKETKFSIKLNKDGSKYVEVDTDQDIFEGKSPLEQRKIAKKYILDNFREKGLILENNNIIVNRTTANEYTHPKNQLSKTTKESKMKASTELDNLLSISKYKESKPDDGRHLFAKDGWDYYETTFKIGNKVYTGLINIGKSNNKKTLYDVTNIKGINQNYSASVKTFSVSLTNSVANNIPQSKTSVKSNSLSCNSLSLIIICKKYIKVK